MTFPNPPSPFTNLAAGNQPISYLDTMFAVLGNASNIACTAVSTLPHTFIALTPNANFYLPTAYTNFTKFCFIAAGTSGGAVTANVGGLATLKVFNPSGVQANSGDVVNGNFYNIVYISSLDTGSGGFLILNATVTNVAPAIQGGFKNLVITVTASNTLTLMADAVTMQNAAGGTVRALSVSNTISTGVTGANGIDTGALALGWYAVYSIYNASTLTTAGLLSLSSTSPTLPAGYTYFARMGWVRSDGSPALVRTKQMGRRAQYIVVTSASATNSIALPNIVNGATGTYSQTAPVYAAISISGTVPANSSSVGIVVQTSWGNGTVAALALAPNNNNYLGGSSVSPPIMAMPSGSFGSFTSTAWFQPESTSVYFACNASGGALDVLGWEDNI